MLAMLERVQKQQNLGYLLISHERRTIHRLAHRLMIMDAGRLYEVGPTQALMSEAKHPYSRLFLGLEPGELPFEEDAVGRVIQGCPFAGTCPAATAQCRTAMPVLREVAPGHHSACHAL
jgi:oligopeptide/dipeptide ABC transporter ATP-binding protein